MRPLGCVIHGVGPQKECPCKRLPMLFSVFTAACYGDIESVRRHLDAKGAADTTDLYGYTAQHYASQGNHVAIVNLLLERGACVNGVARSRCTPLHRAAAAGALEACAILLERGAAVDAVDTSFGDRRTPLMKACSQGHSKIVEMLLGYGASASASDAKGSTAVDLSQPHPLVRRLLLDRSETVDAPANSDQNHDHTHAPSSTGSNLSLKVVSPEERPKSPVSSHQESIRSPEEQPGSGSTEAKSNDKRYPPVKFGMKCPLCSNQMIVGYRAICCRKLLCQDCNTRIKYSGKKCGLCG